jgi:hypothetical protein
MLQYVNKSSIQKNVTEEKSHTSYWKINWSDYQHLVSKKGFILAEDGTQRELLIYGSTKETL